MKLGATIAEWQKAAFVQATKSGFHSKAPDLAVFLMNLHSEVSELWEAWRKGHIADPCDKAGRMRQPLTCLEEELADIVIRCFDTAETFGVDLERAILVKHEFNGTRPPRHGGKLA